MLAIWPFGDLPSGSKIPLMATQLASIPTHPDAITPLPEIIGGPTPIQAPRPGDTFRWKVQHGRAEKHVYVQIAPALHADAFEEPLRSGIATKGESVLLKLLERGNVPTRIKITSAGITEVGVDRRSRVCSL
jgi:acetamidase/formamidase